MQNYDLMMTNFVAEVVKAVIPSFDKVLDLDLPPHLFAGIPHALPADPRLFYIAPNENISSPTIRKYVRMMQ